MQCKKRSLGIGQEPALGLPSRQCSSTSSAPGKGGPGGSGRGVYTAGLMRERCPGTSRKLAESDDFQQDLKDN